MRANSFSIVYLAAAHISYKDFKTTYSGVSTGVRASVFFPKKKYIYIYCVTMKVHNSICHVSHEEKTLLHKAILSQVEKVVCVYLVHPLQPKGKRVLY